MCVHGDNNSKIIIIQSRRRVHISIDPAWCMGYRSMAKKAVQLTTSSVKNA